MTSRTALTATDAEVVAISTGAAALLALTLAVVACGKEPTRDAAPTPEATTRTPLDVPTTAVVEVAAARPPLATPEPKREEAPCAHPKTISPRALAATWPSRLGQCVRLATRLVRSIDVTRALVQGDGASFIVWMSPDAAWVGVKANAFVVMGTASVSLHGRTVLPELLLEVAEGNP